MTAAAETLPALDWTRMPLAGRVLIEASAGTGKTYTIALLYLRLLLETPHGAEQILLATFTDAAAQELRERLRRRLVDAERWLADAAPDVDTALADYLGTRCADAAARRQALRRIRLARADFDRAPIATFHGLCRRIQRDFPLESGAAFGRAAPSDDAALLRECLEDFWRHEFLAGAADARETAAVLEEGPDGLRRDVAALLARDAQLVEADGLDRIDALLAELRAPAAVAELGRLAADASLFARSNAALRKRLQEIAAGDDLAVLLASDKAKYFEAEHFASQVSSTGMFTLAPHPLLALLGELRQLLPLREAFARGRVLARAYAFCRDEIPRRARAREQQTFSMLIDEVHARLAQDGGALAARLAAEFPAALIDEFQDTDRRQYEILDRIFRAPDGAPRGLLVMIGDPKQAIFGFRGGDIAAYLDASAAAAHRFALGVNQRSSTDLVAALNGLYGLGDGGFGDARIVYRDVAAAGRADASPYRRAGAPATALTLHVFDAGSDARNAGELEALALRDCADRIAELLNDASAQLGARRLSPGDVAVLLPTNAQIAQLRRLLAQRRVPCVGSGRGSVFASDTARELVLVLQAVATPNDDRAARGALCTRLMGARFDDLLAWQRDVAAFERELDRFAAWHEAVRTRGVLALVADLVAAGAARLLGEPDGERVLTDLRHLGELLAEEQGARHGVEALCAWLAAQWRSASEGEIETVETRQLRIESDAARVKLLTLHNAKGLEFPLVFLPLAWRARGRGVGLRVLRFHDEAGRDCVDVGSARFAANRVRHAREDLQERLRLLYVGMTRAQHGLHLYVSRATGYAADDAATGAPLDVLLAPARRRLASADDAALAPALASVLPATAALGPAAPNTFEPAAAATPAPGPRAARTPLPALRPFRWLHSFSSLTRHAATNDAASPAADETEMPDAAVDEAAQPDADLAALASLRGPRFGDAVHALLEHAAPGPFWPQQEALLRREFAAAGLRAPLDAANAAAVGALIERVRGADLGGVRLADLGADTCVAEFEFQLPLAAVGVAGLRALCAAHGCADVVPAALAGAVLDGMLTGFIDLVFAHDGRYHVLDYKTNWLGAARSDYAGAALDAAMRAHHYELQALLYTVAVHRYLQQRVRGYRAARHLGDSWYLFLRALGLAPGLGLWRRRWPPALIEALDRAFAGATETIA